MTQRLVPAVCRTMTMVAMQMAVLADTQRLLLR
jgi:hypothetical protein